MTHHLRTHLIVGLQCIAIVMASGCAPSAPLQRDAPPDEGPKATAPSEHHSVVDDMRIAFQQRNPNIVRVRVVDARTPFIGAGKHLVVGWGIREGEFKGDVNDELFGVFVVDDTFTNVERTLDVFPTERWFDYNVRIESSNASKVTIVGRGDTYGDSRMRRTYDWSLPSAR